MAIYGNLSVTFANYTCFVREHRKFIIRSTFRDIITYGFFPEERFKVLCQKDGTQDKLV